MVAAELACLLMLVEVLVEVGVLLAIGRLISPSPLSSSHAVVAVEKKSAKHSSIHAIGTDARHSFKNGRVLLVYYSFTLVYTRVQLVYRSRIGRVSLEYARGMVW